jgi:peptide/nickel transport system substrate-binding protein
MSPITKHAKAVLTAILGVVLCIGVAGVATAASAKQASESAATIIKTAWPADVTTLDVQNLSTDEDHELSRNVYQTLISPRFSVDSHGSLVWQDDSFVGTLAKSWTLGKTFVTFHIRPGVKFYPSGNPLTAADVKWSLDRLWSTPGVGDMEANGVQKPGQIVVVDPMTLRIDFKDAQGKPQEATPTLMAIYREHFTGIVDSVEAKKHATASDPTAAKWLTSNVAGTGPYYVASRTPGVSFDLKAVPNSWQPAPSFSEVQIRITTASVASLMSGGSINVGEYGMTTQQLNGLEKSGIQVVHANTPEFMMFAIAADPGAGPLHDQRVRAAIAYALPYSQIQNDVFFGRATRDLSIVNAQAPEYSPAWTPYKLDLAKAKSLMAAAGNPKITVPLLYLANNTDQQSSALLVQANLKELGIAANLTPTTQAGMFGALDARSQPPKGAKIGPPGVVLFNWSPWKTDPKIVIGYWATTGGINNYSLWSSPTVDAINNKWALKPPSAQRTVAYRQAQKLIATGAANLPIVNTGRNVALAKGVSGASFAPGGGMRFWTLHPTGQSSALDKLYT